MLIFLIFLMYLIIQKTIELFIAKNNEKWLKANGGIEVGKRHYKYMISTHMLFFICLIVEVVSFEKTISSVWFIFMIFFLLAQALRIWNMTFSGKLWNIKLIIVPNVNIITKGPYQYVRYPDYVVAMLEYLVIPLLFNAYITALVFTIANGILLSIRLSIEQRAFKSRTELSPLLSHPLK